MKFFFVTLGALLAVTPAAMAGQLMPNLYASEFCSLRDMGVSSDEARAAAISTAYVSSLPDLPQVTINGSKYDADVVQAYRAVSNRCPHHL